MTNKEFKTIEDLEAFNAVPDMNLREYLKTYAKENMLEPIWKKMLKKSAPKDSPSAAHE